VTAKIAAVRRLMAIRTLGELKKPEALPVLEELTKSQEMFVSEYARRAIATIGGKSFEKPALSDEQRAADLWLLPADCRVILQQTLAGAQSETIDALIDAAQLPAVAGRPPMDKAQMKAELTKRTLLVAEQVGDIRFDGVTAALSSDPGDKSGFGMLIVRARYDAAAARVALRKLQVQTKNVGAMEIFVPQEQIAVLFPSDDRIIIITGASGDQLPIEPMLAALKNGKGELNTVQEMTKLIESIDTKQSLWGVMKVTDAYRKASIIAPFDSITLVGQVKAGLLDLRIEGLGDNANAVKDAAAEVTQSAQQALADLKPAVAQMPFIQHLIEIFESVKCTSEGLRATLTASVKADSSTLLGPMMLFGTPQPSRQPAKP